MLHSSPAAMDTLGPSSWFWGPSSKPSLWPDVPGCCTIVTAAAATVMVSRGARTWHAAQIVTSSASLRPSCSPMSEVRNLYTLGSHLSQQMPEPLLSSPAEASEVCNMLAAPTATSGRARYDGHKVVHMPKQCSTSRNQESPTNGSTCGHPCSKPMHTPNWTFWA